VYAVMAYGLRLSTVMSIGIRSCVSALVVQKGASMPKLLMVKLRDGDQRYITVKNVPKKKGKK
jgi:hypothetical protein